MTALTRAQQFAGLRPPVWRLAGSQGRRVALRIKPSPAGRPHDTRWT
jgi:hypothetical protein